MKTSTAFASESRDQIFLGSVEKRSRMPAACWHYHTQKGPLALTCSVLQAAQAHACACAYTVRKKSSISQSQERCAIDSDPVCGATGGKRPQQLRPRAAWKQPPATTPLPLAGRTPARWPLLMSQRSRCSFGYALEDSTLRMSSMQAFIPTRAGFGSGLCLDVPSAGCSTAKCFLLRVPLHDSGPLSLEGAVA